MCGVGTPPLVESCFQYFLLICFFFFPQLMELKPSCPEYLGISGHFKVSMKNFTIEKIQKIENPRLLQAFERLVTGFGGFPGIDGIGGYLFFIFSSLFSGQQLLLTPVAVLVCEFLAPLF